MAELPSDVVEQILVQSDVEDLIRWKSVCKSWESLITSPRFVEAHLKHSYKSDHDNHELGHRRITCYLDVYTHTCYYLNVNSSYIVGSCNGLVCLCVSPRDVEMVVINPSTREEKKLQTSPYMRDMHRLPLGSELIYWGFGYDAVTDDYKVIAGFRWEGWALFHVLTLKSNTWRVIGKVNYKTLSYTSFVVSKRGILCGGALHWFMEDADRNKAIVSLDLSTEEFKEIPQPTVKEEYVRDENHRLGVIEECLCIYSYDLYYFHDPDHQRWVMRNNKWEELYNNDGGCEGKYDAVHHLNLNPFHDSEPHKWVWKPYIDGVCESHHLYIVGRNTTRNVYSYDDGKRVSNTHGYYLGASIFVKSLVSPHHCVNNKNERPKRDSKGQEGNIGSVTRKRKRKRKRKHKRTLFASQLQ